MLERVKAAHNLVYNRELVASLCTVPDRELVVRKPAPVAGHPKRKQG